MKRLYLYLHTHWDREWYRPFEDYRTDLVSLVRGVCDSLDQGTLPNFYLDGQACVLDDASAVAPELVSRITSFMQVGRLSAGPWYVLADQMLVSGESLVRNLKLGLSLTGKYGQPSLVGYCPDTFGHSQDLPRILSGCGIKYAVVWRGVPPSGKQPAFWWESPDGSRVLAYHLRRGYYQTAFHEGKPASELEWYLLSWLEPPREGQKHASTFDAPIHGALVPVGADHAVPPRDVAATLATIREILAPEDVESVGAGEPDIRIQPISLAEFFKERDAIAGGVEPETTIVGELRDNSGARLFERAYILPGVLSTRLYLKRENRHSEHRLVSVSEPLHALLKIGRIKTYPGDELKHAWKLLLQNHPHDSICGCSVDAVVEDMMTRTRSLHHVLDALDRRAEQAVARNDLQSAIAGRAAVASRDPAFEPNRLVVYNLSGQQRSMPARLSFAQEPDQKVPRGDNMQIISKVTRNELFAEPGLVPYYKVIDIVDAFVWADGVPALGFSEIAWPLSSGPKTAADRVTADRDHVSNGLVTVSADETGAIVATCKLADGQAKEFKLGHKFRDVGDGGDTYNFDPLPHDAPIEATFRSTRAGGKGPLVGSLVVNYEIEIPESHVEVAPGSDDAVPVFARSRKAITHKIKTEITLMRGVPIVFFDTEWENRSTDHRLEVMFDTGLPVSKTWSENHFSLVERFRQESSPLPVEIGCEASPDRFPCQRFVIGNGQVILNSGLPEYGVDGNSVSVTVLRSVSRLSRGRLRTRGGGAGPHLEVPGASCLGLNRARYGWACLTDGNALPDPSEDEIARAYDAAEQFDGCLWTCLSDRNSPPASRSLIMVNNPCVHVMALYCEGQASTYLRLLNTSPGTQTLEIAVGFAVAEAHRCSLTGVPGRRLIANPGASTGALPALSFPVIMGGFELATVRFVIPPPAAG